MTRCAIITGGASGIGLATAQLFLAQSIDVAVIDRDAVALAKVLARGPGRLCCIHADLTDLQALPNVFGSAIRQLGQADILVNSAALTGGHWICSRSLRMRWHAPTPEYNGSAASDAAFCPACDGARRERADCEPLVQLGVSRGRRGRHMAPRRWRLAR